MNRPMNTFSDCFFPLNLHTNITNSCKRCNNSDYTTFQYATNQGTPNLNQLNSISGVSAYEYPIGGSTYKNYYFINDK